MSVEPLPAAALRPGDRVASVSPPNLVERVRVVRTTDFVRGLVRTTDRVAVTLADGVVMSFRHDDLVAVVRGDWPPEDRPS